MDDRGRTVITDEDLDKYIEGIAYGLLILAFVGLVTVGVVAVNVLDWLLP